MAASFLSLLVNACDDCPLRACRGSGEPFCGAVDRDLQGALDTAPTWCPARGGIRIKLDEMPKDYHRWTERGESAIKPQMSRGEISTCKRCGLRRKAESIWRAVRGQSDKRKIWVWLFETPDGEWVSVTPTCKGKETKKDDQNPLLSPDIPDGGKTVPE